MPRTQLLQLELSSKIWHYEINSSSLEDSTGEIPMKIVCDCGNILMERQQTTKPPYGDAVTILIGIRENSGTGMKVQVRCTKCNLIALKVELLKGKETACCA